MYFPFLYGRQSELRALRAMLDDHRSLDALVPILEPVNRNPSALGRCLEAYGKAGTNIAVIMNPDKHELKFTADANAWIHPVLTVVDKYDTMLPAFKCSSTNNFDQISAFLDRFEARQVVLIYSSPTLTDDEMRALAKRRSVLFHVVLNGRMSLAQQNLLPADRRVDIQDNFNQLPRNADYEGSEHFTDQHIMYKGRCAGFGDYTCVGSAFDPGGGPAAAVAIHAIYKSRSGSVWMEHFVSDDTDQNVGNIADKFQQAARKLVFASSERPEEFGSNFALDTYSRHVENKHFPNLASNKVLQIGHHICVMLDVLEGRL